MRLTEAVRSGAALFAFIHKCYERCEAYYWNKGSHDVTATDLREIAGIRGHHKTPLTAAGIVLGGLLNDHMEVTVKIALILRHSGG